MIELRSEQQTFILLCSFVLGAVLFAVYISMALIRVALTPGKIRLFIEDTLFMLFSAVLNFLFALSLTDGIVRLYPVIAELAVFFLLYFTAGKLMLRLSSAIFGFFFKVYRKIRNAFVLYLNKMTKITANKCKKLLKKINRLKK